MNTRLLIMTLLVMLVIGGMVAGLFSGSIEKALMVPAHRQVSATITMKQPVSAQTIPTVPSQMPINLLAQDTFQRKDQALWGMASDTRQWNGDANNPNDQAIFSIVHQTGQIANGQGTFNALLGSMTSDADVTLSGQVSSFTGGVNLGAVLHWQDTDNWYKALIDGTRLRLIRNLQGNTDTLGVLPFHAQAGISYSLRFRALGPMLFVKVWPTATSEPAHWMIATMDTALASGQAGVRVVVRRNTVVTITAFQVKTASNSM